MLANLFHLVLLVKYIVALVRTNHLQSTDIKLKGSYAFLKGGFFFCDQIIIFYCFSVEVRLNITANLLTTGHILF